MYWADQIKEASEKELAKMGFGQFFVNPNTRRLTLINDSLHPKHRNSFPIQPSLGWQKFDDKFLLWCPLGGEKVLTGESYPDIVHRHSDYSITEEEIKSLSKKDIFYLIANGLAFTFCGRLFLLPENQFEKNSFNYEIPNHERLSVFVGYRGHSSNYAEIVTPSLLRKINSPTKEKFHRYKKLEAYGTNLVKQAFLERDNIYMTDIQARGILQHHKIEIDRELNGNTDILDLSYDINIAKWFALNSWNRKIGKFEKKKFKETEFEKAYEETSLVYQVVTRVIGGMDKILPKQFNGIDIQLVPWNLSPLWSERPERQKGFGISDIGPGDFDKNGAIMNIVEHRYHPKFFPNGWDKIGGTDLQLFGESYSIEMDTSHLESQILPKEKEWFVELKKTIERKSKNIHNKH